MTWIFVAVAVAFAGLVVLAVLTVRVLRAANGLSREIAQARAQIAPQEKALHARIAGNRASEG